MTTLEDIRKVYPKANYAPREGCKWCRGSGQRTMKKLDNRIHPCACIFIQHDVVDKIVPLIAESAWRLREEFKQ